jgi:ATP-dependent Zn protease
MPDDTSMPERDETPRRNRAECRKSLIPSGPLLADLHGMAAAKAWGEALAQDLADYIAGRIPWSEVDPGALLHGEPGTGKTLFARALAATCKVPLIVTSYAEWQRAGDGHLGDVLEAMHAVFQRARRLKPAILFIDEIEAVSSRESRGGNERWYTGIITALNEELAGIASREGVVVIAAANYPDRIDPALLRAGRLDTKIFFPRPTADELRGIIRFHLRKELMDADLGALAVAATGSTGADVEKLVRVARRRARKLGRPLRLPDLLAVLGERLQDLPRAYLECIAVHEAGHAVAAIALKASRNVSVSLFHVGKSGAATFFDPQIEAVTRKVVERRIAIALAGRAAEEVLRKEVTAGAGGSDTSDLGVANSLAFWAVARWGLAERERLKWLDCPPEEMMANHPRLAKEAYAMLEAAYARVLRLIRQRAPQVRTIAAALLKRRALAHADIVALLEAPKPGGRARTKRPRRQA